MATDTDTAPSSTSTSTVLVTATSDIGPSEQGMPSQTTTRALTTIFTPPPSCESRYYVFRTSAEFYTEWGITSDASDRLYRSCQPDPEAYNNYYSPGVCPANMDIAGVSSKSEVTDSVTYTDICCQRHASSPVFGFIWNFQSCFSLVSTTTTVLIGPDVSTQDIFIPVSRVAAWHAPIMAVWQTSDISLFPSEVMRQKSSIAEYGWAPTTDSVTPTPSESTTPPSEQNESKRALGPGAIVGIVIAVIAFVFISVALICVYRRRRQQQNRDREPGTALTGSRKTWLRNLWRAETSSPTTQVTELENRQNNKQYEKQATIELDGWSATGPLVQSPRPESAILPISDRAISPVPVP
ncbi:hypothetical protein F5Y09DRAFT_340905 [Xylaria sp. FL1042]|nr:hypothetical protein F5Y09DRAFT_340905 [Xylaria sp. FL1042]